MTKLLSRFFYWVKCVFFKKYHLVDCRSPVNGYTWGYEEPGDLILFANFALLVRFVEKNLPFKYHYSADPHEPDPTLEEVMKRNNVIDKEFGQDLHANELDSVRIGREIHALYNWWTRERVKEHAAVDDFFDKHIEATGTMQFLNDGATTCWEAMEHLRLKDQAMLLRLMEIREALWT